MKVLWIFAHPEPRSLSGSLKDDGLATLRKAGHEVRLRDLYRVSYKAIADAGDFPARDADQRLDYGTASEQAYLDGTQCAEVAADQENLLWADLVLMQFPLWWYGMPAILKGWVDRTFAKGFAYGIPAPGSRGRSLRFGEGKLQGRRAMLVITASGRATALGPRGVGGFIDDILFPIQHGILWYTGMSVLPAFVAYNIGVGRVTTERYAELSGDFCRQLLAAETAEPIPFRYQNRGDYDDDLVLKPGLEGSSHGLAIHLRR